MPSYRELENGRWEVSRPGYMREIEPEGWPERRYVSPDELEREQWSNRQRFEITRDRKQPGAKAG